MTLNKFLYTGRRRPDWPASSGVAFADIGFGEGEVRWTLKMK